MSIDCVVLSSAVYSNCSAFYTIFSHNYKVVFTKLYNLLDIFWDIQKLSVIGWGKKCDLACQAGSFDFVKNINGRELYKNQYELPMFFLLI